MDISIFFYDDLTYSCRGMIILRAFSKQNSSEKQSIVDFLAFKELDVNLYLQFYEDISRRCDGDVSGPTMLDEQFTTRNLGDYNNLTATSLE